MDLENLVSKAKAGDADAMTELFMQFKPYICKCIKSIYISGYDFDDLLQLGYMSIMHAVDVYDLKKNHFNSYVLLSIKNNFNYQIRLKAKNNYVYSLNSPIDDGIELLDTICSEENIEEGYAKKETLKQLKLALTHLDSKERDIIEAVFFNNLSILKYSKDKHLAYSNAYRLYKQALSKLKLQLED